LTGRELGTYCLLRDPAEPSDLRRRGHRVATNNNDTGSHPMKTTRQRRGRIVKTPKGYAFKNAPGARHVFGGAL